MGSVPSPVLPAPSPGPDTQGAGEAAVWVGNSGLSGASGEERSEPWRLLVSTLHLENHC